MLDGHWWVMFHTFGHSTVAKLQGPGQNGIGPWLVVKCMGHDDQQGPLSAMNLNRDDVVRLTTRGMILCMKELV